MESSILAILTQPPGASLRLYVLLLEKWGSGEIFVEIGDIVEAARAWWPATRNQVYKQLQELEDRGLIARRPGSPYITVRQLVANKDGQEGQEPPAAPEAPPAPVTRTREPVLAGSGPAKQTRPAVQGDLITNSESSALSAGDWRLYVDTRHPNWPKLRLAVARSLWVENIRRDVIDRAAAGVALKIKGCNSTEYRAIAARARACELRTATGPDRGKEGWQVVNLAIMRLWELAGWEYPVTVPGFEPRPEPKKIYAEVDGEVVEVV